MSAVGAVDAEILPAQIQTWLTLVERFDGGVGRKKKGVRVFKGRLSGIGPLQKRTGEWVLEI